MEKQNKKAERLVFRNEIGEIAVNEKVVYSKMEDRVGYNVSNEIGKVSINDSIRWTRIFPMYIQYKEDKMLIEIWDCDNFGIILDNGITSNKIGNVLRYWKHTKEDVTYLTYEEAMDILDKKNKPEINFIVSYNNKGLMKSGNVNIKVKHEDSIRGTKEQNKSEDYVLEDDKQNNNGGASDWYSLPKNANTLQDLIEHRNMNGSVKDIFKACYRLGIKTEDELRDLNKMAYYSLREIGRITGRKDYVTIAKELMGSQAIKKDENDI